MKRRRKRKSKYINSVCEPCGKISEISKLVEDKTNIVIDVRSVKEYEKFHVKNTLNVPLAKLEEFIKSGKLSHYANIYSLCYSGERAKKACEKLHGAGFGNSVCLGGIIDISDENTVFI